jgi:hypothetical protein
LFRQNQFRPEFFAKLMTSEPPFYPDPKSLLPTTALADKDQVEEFDMELVIEQILADPNLTQHLTRRSEGGHDTLTGYFRCQLQPDQQRYALHVPLYPAMNGIPDVEAIVMDSVGASVRVTDRQRFGIRLEIQCDSPKTETSNVMVEVIAYCSG